MHIHNVVCQCRSNPSFSLIHSKISQHCLFSLNCWLQITRILWLFSHQIRLIWGEEKKCLKLFFSHPHPAYNVESREGKHIIVHFIHAHRHFVRRVRHREILFSHFFSSPSLSLPFHRRVESFSRERVQNHSSRCEDDIVKLLALRHCCRPSRGRRFERAAIVEFRIYSGKRDKRAFVELARFLFLAGKKVINLIYLLFSLPPTDSLTKKKHIQNLNSTLKAINVLCKNYKWVYNWSWSSFLFWFCVVHRQTVWRKKQAREFMTMEMNWTWIRNNSDKGESRTSE